MESKNQKNKNQYDVDYDIIEGRKLPSKEELEEGELEHLYVVDHDAWEKKMKEKLKPTLPPNRTIREDGKPISQKEHQEEVDKLMKRHRASQQRLDPDIEIRQLKKKVASLETQIKDIWIHMRRMGADIYKIERGREK